MPRWLQVWLGLTLFSFWTVVCLIAVPFVMAQLVGHGERAFTRDERAGLKEQYPGGNFTNDFTYKWCDGSHFIYFDTRFSTWTHGETCYTPKYPVQQ